VTDRLPELLDAKRILAETGMSRAAVEKMMRKLPIVQLPELRKVYVRRSDVDAYIEAHTFAKDEMPA
jgi:predicted DNA-binding transcriptional regulator AlpA